MASSVRAFKAVSPSYTDAVLRIVSYNILADKYAMSAFYDYCPTEYRQWHHRLPRLCKEILGFQGDIVCLQEVETGSLQEGHWAELRQEGFEVSNRSAVTNAHPLITRARSLP